MRAAVFLASVCAAVAAVGALNWWIDPYGDRYDDDAVRAALAQSPPCLVSHAVVGDRTWPEFKLALLSHRRARVAVVGTSRIWSLAAREPGEPFVNLSLPAIDVFELRRLFAELARERGGDLTLYLGTEAMWFGRVYDGPELFGETALDELRILLSGETLRATMSILRDAPGAIRHPDALRAWQVVRHGPRCIVDRGNAVLGGSSSAWGPDGSWWTQADLTRGRGARPQRFVRAHYGDFVGTLQPDRVRVLDELLAFSRERGWRVVGFAPPFDRRSVVELERDPRRAPLLRAFRRRMPPLFARHGFPFLDLTDGSRLGCGPGDFAGRDGAHAGRECAERVRALLDAAA